MSATMARYREVMETVPDLRWKGKRAAEQNRVATYLYFADKATSEGVPFTREYLDENWQRPSAESTFGIFKGLLVEYDYLDKEGMRTARPIPKKWNLKGLDLDQFPPVQDYSPESYKREPEPEPMEIPETPTETAPTLDAYNDDEPRYPINKGLIIHEGGEWEFDLIPDDRNLYADIIGTRVVTYYWWFIGGHRFAFAIDDEGRLKDRQPTVCGPNADPLIVGTAIVFGVTGSGDGLDFRSLTDAEVDILTACSAKRVTDDAIVLTNVTMREFTPWTLEVAE